MSVEIQRELMAEDLPADAELVAWVEAALADPHDAEICIRIVDEAEGRALNRQWRGKDYATNVLSFPGEAPPGLPPGEMAALAGDIVLCAPVIAREAAAQGKPSTHHWTHLVVHGVLHLRGYDHIHADAAVAMEQTECRILAELGVPDPYADVPHGA
ncbi:MAG: rRNA maturation RNase YbeY [Wenzhouxiangellaceae bacterium]|nr:rRNA maturation RNase YbeY [Wenzhouxiangellaceae bacterium]